MFATYCNMHGAAILAWRAGDVPPTSHLQETRRMAEQFGLFSRKSRLIKGDMADGKTVSPFNKFKK